MPLDASTFSTLLTGWPADIRAAAAFLTRIPLADAPAQDSRSLRAYPLIGLGLGLLAGVVFTTATSLGLSPFLGAVAAVAAGAALTGALHEDGLADFADGLAGHDRDEGLEIMRDSRIGTFGVLALVLSIAARIGAIAALGSAGAALAGLIAAGSLSRGAIALVAAREYPAREEGLAAALGKPEPATVFTALGIASVIVLLSLGPVAAILGVALSLVVAIAVSRIARTRFGGYTGDVLGAVQQTSEIAILWTAAAFWGHA